MDISALSSLGAGAIYRPESLYAPARTAAAVAARSAASIPLDPSTGLPLISSQTQIQIVAARAMYEWNLQAIAALRGENVTALAFSASSRSSMEVVQALIQGASFEDAGAALSSSGSYGASGSALDQVLGIILDYFSPAASALRVTGYGLSGASGADSRSNGIAQALGAGTQAAGSGAPSLLLIAMHRAETYSLRYLDLYAESGKAPSFGSYVGASGGYGTYALRALGIDASSVEDILVAYFGPGYSSDGYSPINLYA